MTISPDRIAEIVWNDCVKREFLCYAMHATKPEIRKGWTPSYLYSQVCWHTAKIIGFAQQLAEENNINLEDALNALTAYGFEEHDKNLTRTSSDFSLDAVWKALESKTRVVAGWVSNKKPPTHERLKSSTSLFILP